MWKPNASRLSYDLVVMLFSFLEHGFIQHSLLSFRSQQLANQFAGFQLTMFLNNFVSLVMVWDNLFGLASLLVFKENA